MRKLPIGLVQRLENTRKAGFNRWTPYEVQLL